MTNELVEIERFRNKSAAVAWVEGKGYVFHETRKKAALDGTRRTVTRHYYETATHVAQINLKPFGCDVYIYKKS